MDKLSFEERSRNMSKIKGRDTKPEKLVRRLVYSMGYRYRLHLKNLPGSPDLAFIGKKKAIFVHGCFWHQHSGCRRATVPKTNTAFWSKKLNFCIFVLFYTSTILYGVVYKPIVFILFYIWNFVLLDI